LEKERTCTKYKEIIKSTVDVKRQDSVLVSYRNERSADDEKIQQVESRSAKRAVVDDEAVRDHLEADLDGEDSREEVVKVIENLQRANCAD